MSTSTDHGEDQLTAMTVSIPESLKAWVKARATSTGCATPSEFVRRLLIDAKKAAAREDLEQLLLKALIEGEESGACTPFDMEEIIAAARRKAGLDA